MSYSQTIQLFTPYIGIYCRIVKQTSRGVLIKRCSEKMQQTYRRTPMPKCDFSKVAKQL